MCLYAIDRGEECTVQQVIFHCSLSRNNKEKERVVSELAQRSKVEQMICVWLQE